MLNTYYHFSTAAIITLVLLIISGFTSRVYAQNGKTVTAARISAPVKLDGFLSDSVWESVKPITDFTQRELSEGNPPTEKTEVRIAYDEENLYIGVICHDSEPEKIVRKELMWDGDLEGDDIFVVVLDTFNDQRSGFYFSTNPNGAMHDALIKNVEEINDDWDGVWEVRSRVTDQGWSMEMMIPFMTLRFPNNESQSWGINFMRQIRRKNEEVLWTAWNRDDGILQIAKAGKVDGLSDIRRGRKSELKPYMLGGIEKELNSDPDDKFKYGLDVKYPLTSDLTLDFTTMTDFAQIESDKEQINLTRFSLEYPEKRDFFLEGAEIYDFSQSSSEREGIKLFYSRRIGITPDPDRQIVPILGGAKLSGKAGRYNIGIMNMQTEEKTVTGSDGSKNFYPSTNYTVVRVKRDLLTQSYIGFIGTMVNRTDKPSTSLTGVAERDIFLNKQTNNMAAMDFAFNTSTFLNDKNLQVKGYLAASSTPGLDGDNFAGRLSLDYPNDLVDFHFFYHGIDKNFNPEMGFLRRPGIQEYNSALSYMPRVNLPFIKKFDFAPFSFNYTTDTGDKLLTRAFTVRPLGFILESGDKFQFERHFHFDFVDYDFEVFDDFIIPVKGYKFNHWFIRYESVKNRPVSVDLATSWGGFYSGRRKYSNAAFTFKINRHLAITPDLTYYDVDLVDSSFIARRASVRFQTNISTRLTSSTFIQWNNESGEANMNFRIHYIPKIGSDVYIAYNQLWDEEEDFRTLQNTGILKVNYLYRF
ncbi:hypothetical protein ES708_07093 [subsurface metagenome]